MAKYKNSWHCEVLMKVQKKTGILIHCCWQLKSVQLLQEIFWQSFHFFLALPLIPPHCPSLRLLLKSFIYLLSQPIGLTSILQPDGSLWNFHLTIWLPFKTPPWLLLPLGKILNVLRDFWSLLHALRTPTQLSFPFILTSFPLLLLWSCCFIWNGCSLVVCLANSFALRFAPFCISGHFSYFTVIFVSLLLQTGAPWR